MGSVYAQTGGKQYDLISAFDVLFHIVDDDKYLQALRNLSTWLKPGGTLLMTENFVHHPRKRSGGYHFSRTLDEIESLLHEAGLAITDRSPVFVLMNAPDDSVSPLASSWWKLWRRIAGHGEALGWLAGACLYLPERLLASLLSEGPSTELAVCRKAE